MLNKELQKAKENSQFCQIKYLPFRAVFVLLTENSHAMRIISHLSNIFIWIPKSVHQTIIEVELLAYWQDFKMHGMSLERYLAIKSIKLLKFKVEFLTSI